MAVEGIDSMAEPNGDSSPTGGRTVVSIRRPWAMRLAGRTGMSYVLALGLLLGGLAGAVRGEVPPPWFVLGLVAAIFVDCVGSVTVTSETVRFRRILRAEHVATRSVRAVSVGRGVGYRGAVPVVVLVLDDGRRRKVRPLASISRRQVAAAARSMDEAIITLGGPR